MATMTTGTLTGMVDEVVTSVAMDKGFYGPSYAAELYFMRATDQRRERNVSYNSFDEFTPKLETAMADQDEIVQQFEKTLVQATWAKYYTVSREMVDFNEWNLIAKLGLALGNSFRLTIEKRAAALFNDAFAGATYKAEDALSICNAAHVNSAGGNSQSNTNTLALDVPGIDTSRGAMRGFLDYRGVEQVDSNPDTLLVPIGLERAGWEVAKSFYSPANANHTNNMYDGMFRLLVWNKLTDQTDWFMVDSAMAKRDQQLVWLWGLGLELYGDGDLFTQTRREGGTTRFVHGCYDWKWIYGNHV